MCTVRPMRCFVGSIASFTFCVMAEQNAAFLEGAHPGDCDRQIRIGSRFLYNAPTPYQVSSFNDAQNGFNDTQFV